MILSTSSCYSVPFCLSLFKKRWYIFWKGNIFLNFVIFCAFVKDRIGLFNRCKKKNLSIHRNIAVLILSKKTQVLENGTNKRGLRDYLLFEEDDFYLSIFKRSHRCISAIDYYFFDYYLCTGDLDGVQGFAPILNYSISRMSRG